MTAAWRTVQRRRRTRQSLASPTMPPSMANRANSSRERFREVNVTFERRRSTRCVPIPTARAAITRKLTRCSTIKISYFGKVTVATAQSKMEETAPPVEAGDDTLSSGGFSIAPCAAPGRSSPVSPGEVSRHTTRASRCRCRPLKDQILECLEQTGGEVSARSRAAALGQSYLSLNPEEDGVFSTSSPP